MVLKNHSSYVGICSDWLYARTLRAVLCGRWLCGHCDLAQRRRGAEFFGDWLYARTLKATNRGINPLATVFAVRLGICSDWLYARTQCYESRDQPARYGMRSRTLRAVLCGR